MTGGGGRIFANHGEKSPKFSTKFCQNILQFRAPPEQWREERERWIFFWALVYQEEFAAFAELGMGDAGLRELLAVPLDGLQGLVRVGTPYGFYG